MVNLFERRIFDYVQAGSSLRWASRTEFADLNYEQYQKIVLDEGLPLVASRTTKDWQNDSLMFTPQWLKENFGHVPLIRSPRDVKSLEDLSGWTLGQYIEYIYRSSEQRDKLLYGKDIPCPDEWRQIGAEKLKPYFCYEVNDLFGELPKLLQPVTLTLRIGYEGTLTSSRFATCSALDHNLMVWAEPNACAYWFCVKPADKQKAMRYWRERGCSIHNDSSFMELDDLAAAPFEIYIIKQQEGDLVFLPADTLHQYISFGGRHIQMCWNRIHPRTIKISYEMLNYNHKYCKAELYRIKTVAYYALKKRTEAILSHQQEATVALVEDMQCLLEVVNDAINSEWIGDDIIQKWQIPVIQPLRINDSVPHTRVCYYCYADIWNRCYHCSKCKGNGYDICLTCVAEGRGCIHNKDLVLMEYMSMREVKDVLENALTAHIELTLRLNSSQPQKVLKLKFPEPTENSIGSIAFDMVKRHQQEQREEWCHQCKLKKSINCIVTCQHGRCGKRFCGYCLWNRYCIRQIDVERTKSWKCLVCSGMCNCARCLRSRMEDPVNLCLKFDELDLVCIVPPYLSENENARGSIYDREPRPRAANNEPPRLSPRTRHTTNSLPPEKKRSPRTKNHSVSRAADGSSHNDDEEVACEQESSNDSSSSLSSHTVRRSLRQRASKTQNDGGANKPKYAFEDYVVFGDDTDDVDDDDDYDNRSEHRSRQWRHQQPQRSRQQQHYATRLSSRSTRATLLKQVQDDETDHCAYIISSIKLVCPSPTNSLPSPISSPPLEGGVPPDDEWQHHAAAKQPVALQTNTNFDLRQRGEVLENSSPNVPTTTSNSSSTSPTPPHSARVHLLPHLSRSRPPSPMLSSLREPLLPLATHPISSGLFFSAPSTPTSAPPAPFSARYSQGDGILPRSYSPLPDLTELKSVSQPSCGTAPTTTTSLPVTSPSKDSVKFLLNDTPSNDSVHDDQIVILDTNSTTTLKRKIPGPLADGNNIVKPDVKRPKYNAHTLTQLFNYNSNHSLSYLSTSTSTSTLIPLPPITVTPALSTIPTSTPLPTTTTLANVL
jgi:hypothetical protein